MAKLQSGFYKGSCSRLPGVEWRMKADRQGWWQGTAASFPSCINRDFPHFSSDAMHKWTIQEGTSFFTSWHFTPTVTPVVKVVVAFTISQGYISTNRAPYNTPDGTMYLSMCRFITLYMFIILYLPFLLDFYSSFVLLLYKLLQSCLMPLVVLLPRSPRPDGWRCLDEISLQVRVYVCCC